MSTLNLLAKTGRLRVRLARIPAPGHLAVAAALFAGVGLAAWGLGWPPSDTGTWRYAKPFIALAAAAGRLHLVYALEIIPRRGAWRGQPAAEPRPVSYRDMAAGRLRVLAHRAARVILALAGTLILISAAYDLLAVALPGVIPVAPWFSMSVHALYVLALIFTEPVLLGYFAGFLALALAVEFTARAWPADDDARQRFALACLADSAVRDYREALDRLGRRLTADDMNRLGGHLAFSGGFDNDKR